MGPRPFQCTQSPQCRAEEKLRPAGENLVQEEEVRWSRGWCGQRP